MHKLPTSARQGVRNYKGAGEPKKKKGTSRHGQLMCLFISERYTRRQPERSHCSGRHSKYITDGREQKSIMVGKKKRERERERIGYEEAK